MKKRTIHRCACYAFLAAAAVLYAAGLAADAFVYGASLWELIRDAALPLALTAAVYALDWHGAYTAVFLFSVLPKAGLWAVIAAPVAAAVVSVAARLLWGSSEMLPLLASLAMAVPFYALRFRVKRALPWVVAEAVGFGLLAIAMGDPVALVTVLCCAAALLLALRGQSWLFHGQQALKKGSSLWLAVQGVAAVALILLWMSMGGNGTPVTGAMARLLSDAGWGAVAPLLAAAAVLVAAGVYVTGQSVRLQHFYGVAFLVLLTVRLLACGALCFGSQLNCPVLCPFLDGNFWDRTACVLMAVSILPPKQKEL